MKKLPKSIGLLVVFAMIFYLPASAQTISELKKQVNERNKDIARLEAEIKEYQENIEEAESSAKTLQNEIGRLDNIIKQLNSKISLTQQRIIKKELEIKEFEFNIEETEADIVSRKIDLKLSIVLLGETEREDAVSRFFKYNSVSDFFSELEKLEVLANSINNRFEILSELKEKFVFEKNTAEDARAELERLRGQLLSQLELQKDSKLEKSSLLKTTKNQEALYQKLLKDREQKRVEIYEEIRKIETELRKKIDLASLPQFGKGVLALPIDGGVITQEFGNTSFAQNTDVYGNNFHNGIDFRASPGTPIKSAESGVIKSSGNTDLICRRGSYGKWILIEHENNLSTLYAHLSVIGIDNGQSVKKGDMIGYSGNSGYTTGPHLHFTVYDARTVELRQSRVCGILPYGGYLDPLNYL